MLSGFQLGVAQTSEAVDDQGKGVAWQCQGVRCVGLCTEPGENATTVSFPNGGLE